MNASKKPSINNANASENKKENVNGKIYLRGFFGLLICLVGIIICMHASDLNPLWAVPGYQDWLVSFTILKWIGESTLLWILVCLCIGIIVTNYGAGLLMN